MEKESWWSKKEIVITSKRLKIIYISIISQKFRGKMIHSSMINNAMNQFVSLFSFRILIWIIRLSMEFYGRQQSFRFFSVDFLRSESIEMLFFFTYAESSVFVWQRIAICKANTWDRLREKSWNISFLQRTLFREFYYVYSKDFHWSYRV